MKTKFFYRGSLIAGLFFTASIFSSEAQDPSSVSNKPLALAGTELYSAPVSPVTKEAAQFHGGESALTRYIQNSIQYPQQALSEHKRAKVTVGFCVDEKGKVSDAKIIGDKSGYGFDEEALRIVNDMPNWIPAKLGDTKVKTYYSLPIEFKL